MCVLLDVFSERILPHIQLLCAFTQICSLSYKHHTGTHSESVSLCQYCNMLPWTQLICTLMAQHKQ